MAQPAPAERRLTLAEAATLGINQPQVSAFVRGRLDGISLERLMHLLKLLGRDVVIVVKPKPKGRRRAMLSVA